MDLRQALVHYYQNDFGMCFTHIHTNINSRIRDQQTDTAMRIYININYLVLVAPICIELNNSALISKIYFAQCLFFTKITQLQRLYIFSLDAVRLSSSCETQTMLIEKTLRETQHWKGRRATMSLDASEFLFFDSAIEARNDVNTSSQKPAVF